MFEARGLQIAKENQIKEFITSMNDIDHFIDSAHSIITGIRDKLAITVTYT